MGLKIQRLLTESAYLQFQKGFTLIGVLVAAAVGVIVIAGVSQMFANMAGQLKQMEDRTKRIFFDRLVGAEFVGDACRRTLRDNNVALANGNAIRFSQLKNEAGQIILDLSAEKERLESRFGITGNTYFSFSCNNPQPDGSLNCDCESAFLSVPPPTECVKTWTLSFITQRRVKGLFVYDKGLSVQVVIRYPQKPSDALSVPSGTPPEEVWKYEAYNHFECTDSLLVLGGGVDCYEVKDNGKSLVGCGTTTDNPENTTAYGFNAGYSGTGQHNTFIGYEAGKSTAGDNNTFIGYEAGKDNTTASQNTFIGTGTGASNLTGVENVLMGSLAGATTTSGDGNVFIGYNAGNTSAYATTSNRFIVGNNKSSPSSREWIVGEIGTDNVWINDYLNARSGISGKRICLEDGTNCPTTASAGISPHTHAPSSRTLKKNIKPFKDFKKALKDLLKTPLFTYEYKKDHPEKNRMGVISEELPEHLQIKEKEGVSVPDWPSIYGTFWAGIKALHKKFTDFQTKIVSQLKSLSSTIEDLKQQFSELKITVAQLKDQLVKHIKEFTLFQTDTKTQLEQTQTTAKQNQKELAKTKSQLSDTDQELKDLKTELSNTKRELEDVKAELKKLQAK